MHAVLALAVAVVAMVAACTSAGPGATAASPSAVPSSGAPGESIGTSAPDPTGSTVASQTDTDWGRIWDSVPPGFPRYPGSTTAADATAEPFSAVYAIDEGDVAEMASWMQTNLELATYSTEALSGPFEDGSYVLDSVGDAGCRIQTKVAPMGSLVLVTILYGASCPQP